MNAKSREEEDGRSLVNLREVLNRLRKYQLKLNCSKCVFGVTSSKLFGIIFSGIGIKIDPAKIKAIHDIPTPRAETKVRCFLGRLNYMR